MRKVVVTASIWILLIVLLLRWRVLKATIGYLSLFLKFNWINGMHDRLSKLVY